MEDIIEIIFYVVILLLSGIGSLLKNKKKQEKPLFSPEPNQKTDSVESELDDDVVEEMNEPEIEEENELVRMLREAAAAAEAQQRAKEALEQQQRAEELRQKEIAEQQRKAEQLRLERERELAKQQAQTENVNSEARNDENSSVFGLNLSDVDEARKAFIASEIFNKKYC